MTEIVLNISIGDQLLYVDKHHIENESLDYVQQKLDQTDEEVVELIVSCDYKRARKGNNYLLVNGIQIPDCKFRYIRSENEYVEIGFWPLLLEMHKKTLFHHRLTLTLKLFFASKTSVDKCKVNIQRISTSITGLL